MIIVIIAGGSGTRLWPLSTKEYPKHLLKLTGEKSLLQNTYERIKDLSDEIFVITEKSHSMYVSEQLPEIPGRRLLAEPARRGTASCLVLALCEIKKRRYSNQPIFFLWADHLVKDKAGFKKAVELAAQLAQDEKRLVFMGVKPSYASTGFGYIQQGASTKTKGVHELKQFVEKPDKKRAETYLKNGKYLWNTGYLMGTLETFERELKQQAPRLWNDYHQLLSTHLPISRKKAYLNFISEPIDTALSEHVPDGLVVEGKFDWADVGSFSDLHGVSNQDKTGNHISGDNIELSDVSDSYVRNETGIPVVAIGINDVAVIATDNGILVTNKKHAQQVGDIAKRLQAKDKKSFKWLEKLEDFV